MKSALIYFSDLKRRNWFEVVKFFQERILCRGVRVY